MKTIDHVKKHLKEWPKGCTYICVDDDGRIWLNNGDPSKADYHSKEGIWLSSVNGYIPEAQSDNLEDNDKLITKEDWDKKEDYKNKEGWYQVTEKWPRHNSVIPPYKPFWLSTDGEQFYCEDICGGRLMTIPHEALEEGWIENYSVQEEDMKMKLVSWSGWARGVTVGKEYYINPYERFKDDRGEFRGAWLGEWDSSKEEHKMTVGAFDEELKALLKKAVDNGINVKRIESSMQYVSTMSESRYILMDYNVEYEKRG